MSAVKDLLRASKISLLRSFWASCVSVVRARGTVASTADVPHSRINTRKNARGARCQEARHGHLNPRDEAARDELREGPCGSLCVATGNDIAPGVFRQQRPDNPGEPRPAVPRSKRGQQSRQEVAGGQKRLFIAEPGSSTADEWVKTLTCCVACPMESLGSCWGSSEVSEWLR